MSEWCMRGQLKIADVLCRFIEDEALPGTGVAPAQFWNGLASLIQEFQPQHRAALRWREHLQAALDDWHRQHDEHDAEEYLAWLRQIGYLVTAPTAFEVETPRLDAEIAEVAGPQLVVPVSNARYALNAANARWGSLYDALYGSDVVPDSVAPRGSTYNPVRGAEVIARAKRFLDETAPLERGSHADVTGMTVQEKRLCLQLAGGDSTSLRDPALLVGFTGDPQAPTSVLLRDHGLHIELQIDREHRIGRDDPAGIKDIVMEAAVTTIQDCEDSVAAVDAADKVGVYRNWLGLMRGTLAATFPKAGQSQTRQLNTDRRYCTPDGGELVLPGRSLLLVRNVGIHMFTDAVLGPDGTEIPEGILDALTTVVCAMHDLRGTGALRNSRTGSVYIVKPKLHGPEEVALTCRLFDRVESILGLDKLTLKLGVMDEERRTSLNLKACIYAARHRLAFINTGFLDRTGDEIHSLMWAGPVVRKDEMKQQRWLQTYEARNVAVGLACGLSGRAQIGKGMWAKPDEMAEMLATKQAHPEAGANCAWVPSPTAAVLHALHYHQVDVAARQSALSGGRAIALDGLVEPPLLRQWPSAAEIQEELDNNCQSILGYVVRWVEQGVGCSKVPDIHQVGLMEDRATLRIASQLLANWLIHRVCTRAQVEATLRGMAAVVDKQNAGVAGYQPMSGRLEQSAAFQAARELILRGHLQPNGYTEPVLHAWRRRAKREAVEAAVCADTFRRAEAV